MEKYYNRLSRTNDRQIEFGRLLGLNLTGLTERVAFAMISENIDMNFKGLPLKMATSKQIELGERFGFDFNKLTVGVASAYIRDIMEALNYKSIDEQNIKSGDHVINKHDKYHREYIVSSIGKEGYIYFKKINNTKAGGSARTLIKINKTFVNELFKEYGFIEN